MADAAFHSFASAARRKRTLCGDRACRSALAAAPRKFVLSLANPLQRLHASKRSCCGAARMWLELSEPFAEIAAPCEFVLLAVNPVRRPCASKRRLCLSNPLAAAPFDSLFSLLANRCLEVVLRFVRQLSRSRVVSGSTFVGPRQVRLQNRNCSLPK